MNNANVMELEEPDMAAPTAPCCEVRIPAGLLGFEQFKDYLLIANPADAPFRRLRVKDDPSLGFVVIEPFFFVPDYKPDLPTPDVDSLGLASPDDAAVFNIVTIHGPRNATVNLKGPVVINRNTGVAKQVVIANAADYSVEHPLPVCQTDA